MSVGTAGGDQLATLFGSFALGLGGYLAIVGADRADRGGDRGRVAADGQPHAGNRRVAPCHPAPDFALSFGWGSELMLSIGSGTAAGDAGTRPRRRRRAWRGCRADLVPVSRRRAARRGLSVVRPPDADERGRARPQRRRHRGADRRGLPHQRCARAAGRRPRPAPAHQRRQSGDALARNLAADAGASALVLLLRRSRPFRHQHHRQRHRDAALGEGPRLQVADRRHLEFPHAARHGRAGAPASGRDAGAVCGGFGQGAGRGLVGQPGDREAAVFGVSEVYRRQSPYVASISRSLEPANPFLDAQRLQTWSSSGPSSSTCCSI